MNQHPQSSDSGLATDDEVDLAQYLDVLVDNRWVIASVAAVFVLIGALYATFSKSVYEADILIQVEEGQGGVQSLLSQVPDFLAVKTAASAEIEILRSRLVVAQAVDNLKLYLQAQPKYFPVIGAWVSRGKEETSSPGFLGLGGYAWGGEKIELTQLDVPGALQGERLTIRFVDGEKYELTGPGLEKPYEGVVGRLSELNTNLGLVSIFISQLTGKPGTEYLVQRNSRLQTIEQLQAKLRIAEKGKQSSVIGATLEGTNPILTAEILNEIGHQYVKQNVERKSAEAENSLDFLNAQLPELRKELEQAEDRYNSLRNKRGTIDLGEEAKLLLQQSVSGQMQILELQQKRQELLTRFTAEHPSVRALDRQTAEVNRELNGVLEKIKKLPSLEQDVLRLTRDVKVNTDLYATLLNNAQQLRMIRAGRIGNVRLVDEAYIPEIPVKPKRSLILGAALLLGLLFGVAISFLRNRLFGGVSDPQDIEDKGGVPVYATIPYSSAQKILSNRAVLKERNAVLLAASSPDDPAVEALRSLRTAIQFAMLDAGSNIILITGATPGVGKSFVSSNLAQVIASAGKRVLLIDGDLRKGYLNQYFGLGRENGLTELISGTIGYTSAIRKEILERVDFIPTGVLPPNPAELMMTVRLREILQDLSKEYDFVLIDTPPVLAASDTGVMAAYVGAVFLVARAELTTIGELLETKKRLARVGVTPKGVVFNGLNASARSYAYGGRYGRYRYVAYSYGPDR